MKSLPIILVCAMASLAGCASAQDGAFDETISEEEGALLPSTPFTLHNYQTGYCMGVAAGTPTVGTPLVVWDCDQSTNQTWSSARTKEPTQFVAVNNKVAVDRCLNSTNLNNGAAATINTCGKELVQTNQWKAVDAGSDLSGHPCYRFQVKGAPSKVVGVSGGSTARGTGVILWDNFNNSNTHPDQIWCAYPAP